ncbi:hypothetical protein [Nonomuraea insulae]|uniref:Fibronectin type-III domain-containing protein n=1 Tax=Nonomuraea insulae TaxID=1616787 RepID=A0ABW1CVD1_9ACTN
MSETAISPPRNLTAQSVPRDDGSRGIQLEWAVGQNHGEDWPPPPDWNNGDAPYPKHYELWLDGERKEAFDVSWTDHMPGWTMARTHWACLDTEPAAEYRVKIRAELADGLWSSFTDEITVHMG